MNDANIEPMIGAHQHRTHDRGRNVVDVAKDKFDTHEDKHARDPVLEARADHSADVPPKKKSLTRNGHQATPHLLPHLRSDAPPKP